MALSTATAETFTRAVTDLRAGTDRREIIIRELSAPRGLAPFSFALSASVVAGRPVRAGPDPDELATGRLVLLYDPSGQPAWEGTMRLVSFVAAGLEPDLATDALLAEVGWSWLVDALESHRAGYVALGGTVTQTTSTRFGGLAGPPPETDVEIRASWTPVSRGDLAAHRQAWCSLLASAAGLPPPGVSALLRP